MKKIKRRRKKKIKSEEIHSKKENIREQNIGIKSYDNADTKSGKVRNTFSTLLRRISQTIEDNNNKVISLRSSLKDQDFDYLKSIIIRKQSKIDYEKDFGSDIYEIRENYEGDLRFA